MDDRPSTLSGVVRVDANSLSLRVAVESWEPGVLGPLAMGLAGLGIVATVASGGLLLFAWLLWLPLIMGALLWRDLSVSKRRSAVVSDGTVALTGLYAPSVEGVDAVYVSGAPGQDVVVQVGNLVVLNAQAEEYGPWGPAEVTWLARQLSRRLGVPVTDTRPHSEWAAWAGDPVVRAATEFDRRLASNETEHPAHHAMPPARVTAEIEPHGMRISLQRPTLIAPGVSIYMSAEGLRCGEVLVPLDEVVRADVFYRGGAGQPMEARFHVLHKAGWVELFVLRVGQVPGDRTRALNWLGGEILERAEQARHTVRHDPGQMDDVPDALSAMLGTQAMVKSGR